MPVIKLKADLQSVQQLMREKAKEELDQQAHGSDSEEEQVQLLPYVQLDPEMRILNIDITFDGIAHQNNYF